jgi:uroporphyrinogen III methyltransferase / synthase
MLPLSERRIVVTRPSHQAEELAAPLRHLGAEVILLPVISILPPGNPEALRQAARRLDSYDWIIFSSVNAVAALLSEFGKNALRPRTRIAVVGSATKEAVERHGWSVDAMPDEFVAERLAEVLSVESLAGQRVLFPSAAVSRDVLPRALRDARAIVDVVEAYRTAQTPGLAEAALQIFSEPFPDWVIFASPSAVENLLEVVAPDAVNKVRIASIGPVTSAALRSRGLTVHAEPAEHTVPGIIEALVRHEA